MFFTDKFVQATNGFNTRQRLAAEMLIAGVAFQEDGKTWGVYSHEGDNLGKLSTFVVSEVSCMLNKAGLKRNNSPHFRGPNAHPTKPGYGVCTFAYNDFPIEVVQEIMDRRFRHPQVLL
jgi:hypothetical protein